MKNISFSCLLFLFVGIMFSACKKKDAEVIQVINADDFSLALPINSQNNTIVGTANATTNSGTLTYTFASQEVAGALAINSTTGQITVASEYQIYRHTCVPNRPASFKATLMISNGSVSKTITLTIDLGALVCVA